MIAESHTPPRPVRADEASDATAPLVEVFASVQGEGLHVGEPQVFVRLRGCPLRCRFCDTPGSWAVRGTESARAVARDPETGEPSVGEHPGRVTAFRALCLVAAAEGGRPRTISVTGGEPLLWPGFVLALARLAGERRIHLETAGGHPRALERVADAVHHVSLDLKLPSALDAPVELADAVFADGARPEPAPADAAGWRRARRRALELVRGRDACGKIVLAAGTDGAELDAVLDDVAVLAPELPVVLQPVTAAGGERPPSARELERALERALDRELRVLVLPQVHRALGVA